MDWQWARHVKHVKEILRGGEPARVRAHDRSMATAIKDGDFLTVEPAASTVIQVGDIVLATADGQDCVRRVRAVDGQRLSLRADWSGASVWVGSDAIHGRCARVERNGTIFTFPGGRFHIHAQHNAQGRLVAEYRYYGRYEHGPCRRWHDNGAPAFEGTYFGGLLHGEVREWNTDGTLIAAGRYDLDDPVDGDRCEYWEGSCRHGVDPAIPEGCEPSVAESWRRLEPYLRMEPDAHERLSPNELENLALPCIPVHYPSVDFENVNVRSACYWVPNDKDDKWPTYDGEPLAPLLQVRTDELNVVPDALQGIALLSVFAGGGTADAVVRAHKSLEDLRLIEPGKPALCEFGRPRSDYPDDNEMPAVLQFCLEQAPRSTERPSAWGGDKIGGWPTCPQNRTAWRYRDFVLQFTQDDGYDAYTHHVFRSRVDGSFFATHQIH